MLSGGIVSGATLSGGKLEIQGGGTTGSGIVFAGGGTLKLDNSVSFSSATAISGFGIPGQLDLSDVSFSSSGMTLGYSGNTLSGTLTVGDGVHTAHLSLVGQYVVGNFHLANDGNGGTAVTDPPVDSGGQFAQPHA